MSVLEYSYDFGDGSPVVKHTVTDPVIENANDTVDHTFLVGGTFTVTVTLRERKGELVGQVLGIASTEVVAGKQPAQLDYGGYRSGYSFPNYATSG